MQIIPGNAQHIGSRKEQQDDFGFTDLEDVTFVEHGGVLAIITDGMGGLSQGREASQLAKLTMLENYEKKSIDETIPQRLWESLLAANVKVVEMAQCARIGRTDRHHLSINYARAWALWSIYNITKDDKFLNAYLIHIEKGNLLHAKYKDDYYSHAHWVPQFAIYAITSSFYKQ